MKTVPTKSTPSPRQAQACERRAGLIRAATEIFSEEGFQNSSIKDLGGAIGVAPGLIYHYFENKRQFLLAVVEEDSFFQDCAALIETHSGQSASKSLPRIAKSYYELLGRKQQILRRFCREAMADEQIRANWIRSINETVLQLSRYLDGRVAAGELRPHNTEVSARMLLHPTAMLCLTGAPADSLPELVQCIFRGIESTESRKLKGKRHA